MVYVNIDRGLYNLVVLLDLKKAFDTVNHGILLHKLQLYGFEIRALNFMQFYLTNRTQRCQLKGLFSDRREVTCGTPQGSILGPLLFIIYINDLQNCLKITTPRMFADDKNLTAVGETLGEAEQRAGLDLRNVQKWLSLNKLSLNIGKGLSERLQKLQNRATRLITNLKNEHGHSVLARNSLGWELLQKRRVEMKARIMYKTVNKLAPSRLCDLLQNVNKINDYNVRGFSTRVYIPMPKIEFLKQSFCYDGAKIWSQIPDEIRNSASLTSFCSKLSSSTFDLS